MYVQPQTREQLHQRAIHLSDQGWAAFAALHEDIRDIASGGPQDDSDLIRKVFAHVDCELHLKKHEAESPHDPPSNQKGH